MKKFKELTIGGKFYRFMAIYSISAIVLFYLFYPEFNSIEFECKEYIQQINQKYNGIVIELDSGVDKNGYGVIIKDNLSKKEIDFDSDAYKVLKIGDSVFKDQNTRFAMVVRKDTSFMIELIVQREMCDTLRESIKRYYLKDNK